MSVQVASQAPGFILGGIGWESEDPSLLLLPSQSMAGVSHEYSLWPRPLLALVPGQGPVSV